jgi:DNA-binding ferritin-like protein
MRLPGGLFAQTRCARHIDATARRIAHIGAKITTLSSRLHAGSIPGTVDADRSLRRMLGELKEDLAAMRRDLARWHSRECAGRAGTRLEAAIARLNQVNVDTHVAADRLLGQIEEYDAARP